MSRFLSALNHRRPRFVLALAVFAPLHGADAAWTLKTVYSFQGGNDGAYPYAAVIDTGGKLYGTTQEGGGSGCGNSGCGSVFKLTTGGSEAVLFSFGSGASDGNTPIAPLLNVKGTLYGTTEQGGAGIGVVFSITPSGTEKTIYTFQGGNHGDGGLPYAGLIDVNGTLYGTSADGPLGYGAIFSVTPSGSEKIVYAFKGGSDGDFPTGGLIDVNGSLYGTTQTGGASNYGTVFKVTTSGSETIVYSFKDGTDGSRPHAALRDIGGALYGTTRYGGGTGCGGDGCGTVFKVTTGGVETVLHRFKGGSDGAAPIAPLISSNGTLYGTTLYGGQTATNCNTEGCGTVFDVTTSGTLRILHRFSGTSDGSQPAGSLLDVSGTLYGTTTYGAGTGCAGGCGSVFSLKQ